MTDLPRMPSRMMLDLEKTRRAERAVEDALERGRGPATLEERRALRDEYRQGVDDAVKRMQEHRDEAITRAVMHTAARCESEADAEARIRIEQVDRSRGRTPSFCIWLDGVRVWEGAFEQGALDATRVEWIERWHSYPGPELGPMRRWLAEPTKQCARVTNDEHGEHFVAKVQRAQTDDAATMYEARATDPETAVRAVYEQIDAAAAEPGPGPGESVQ